MIAILIALGFIVGILASISGLGGGFLIAPLLMYMGKEARIAVGTSFLFVLLVAISSLVTHIRLGHVDFKLGLILSGGGILGAQIGPLLLQHIPDPVFKRGFAALLAVLAIWLLVDSRA